MKINFGMWKKSLSVLVKMDGKAEWDALDVISKWLIATRSAVTTVTIYACVIGGLLAIRDGVFSFLPWLVITLGLFIAHGTNNLLNDYTDFSRGVDQDDYFRTQYGVHPLVQGFWTKKQQLKWFYHKRNPGFSYRYLRPGLFGVFPGGAGIIRPGCLWCCSFIPGRSNTWGWVSFPSS